ncbi:MAG: hypothetical protein IJV04_07345, partial [Lachnospiraceae bacterium]|nr:hypothetical protein [Lachnospiraceae bacterium]
EGKLYRSSGSMEYSGEFARNMKEGEGILYNVAGDAVYKGPFSRDDIVYASMIGKTSSEMAQCYTGRLKLYSSDEERVRLMEDINAMTEEVADSQSIDEDATVGTVYVLSDSISVGETVCTTFNDLAVAMGEPTYVGESYATLPELLAINRLNEGSDINILNGPATVTENDMYTEYTQVDDYQDDYVVYLHSYRKDGLVYNFVSGSTDSHFQFYYILAAAESGSE